MTMPRQQVIVSRFGVPIPGQNEAALRASRSPTEVIIWADSPRNLDDFEADMGATLPRYTDVHWNGTLRSTIEYLLDLDALPGERFHVVRTSSRKDRL